MKGDAKVIEFLNKVLYNELAAINQYFLHYRMFKDWGYNELAKHEYEESIEEMKHADKLIERILFLDGLPNLQHLGKLRIGENVVEALQGDLDLEMIATKDLREAIAYSEGIHDFVSRDLFKFILGQEEEHIDWLETQFSLISDIGPERYMLSKVGKLSD
ncbi:MULTISPECIES: bacterioferritin [Luteibacter]|jgi:bacterioferritin|uniref:Bacterioferritin n=1 Tax=Luteibacter rhizovicinus DSM 16549 TaxID=1440763 RepID=A0A0G9HJ39_9GAMM|nr:MULTISPECIES: bacterioferritin [Luteibacter]KLD79502.1 bacterioferritin [Xanthomonas hyacinthi DSM 19077]APG03494.1 bacterioferritin [Luteibacter rhizovicinus DSM 16549]KLD67682.1 bacterioferritin [Luteibacter rhizovicinus DSM 16549]PTR35333.1 bacterioferritin [Luteibacter sp. OK325]HVI56605.1 bacterioferritin [Luteibacter sp.]